MIATDVVILGGGIAGASLAYRLAGRAKTVLLEAENQPGYHSTGRSAALFTTTYGHPIIRGLTIASRAFLETPPSDVSDASILTPRGALWIANEEQAPRVAAVVKDIATLDPTVAPCSPAEAFALCPVLDRDYVRAAIREPDARDIEVSALHQGYLRAFRKRGGVVVTDARVNALRRLGKAWEIDAAGEHYSCGVVVNATGAWADEVAMLAGASPVGLTPKRRTAITFDTGPGDDVRGWPCILDLDETFYFKPDAGRILASPADETPVVASDAQPEDIDVAITVDRIERATTLKVRQIRSKWAGLRTFAADKVPVVGMDPTVPGFFWLAGQGGYGIMTSPALGAFAAALILDRSIPEDIAEFGIDAATMSPARFASAGRM